MKMRIITLRGIECDNFDKHLDGCERLIEGRGDTKKVAFEASRTGWKITPPIIGPIIGRGPQGYAHWSALCPTCALNEEQDEN